MLRTRQSWQCCPGGCPDPRWDLHEPWPCFSPWKLSLTLHPMHGVNQMSPFSLSGQQLGNPIASAGWHGISFAWDVAAQTVLTCWRCYSHKCTTKNEFLALGYWCPPLALRVEPHVCVYLGILVHVLTTVLASGYRLKDGGMIAHPAQASSGFTPCESAVFPGGCAYFLWGFWDQLPLQKINGSSDWWCPL